MILSNTTSLPAWRLKVACDFQATMMSNVGISQTKSPEMDLAANKARSID